MVCFPDILYKNFVKIAIGVKEENEIKPIKKIQIYKSATKVSLLDVQPALSYHKRNKDNMIYKGNIIFIIKEYATTGKQLQAFLSKATTKMIMNTIINYSFPQLFSNGFKSYGGTISTGRARILTINFEVDKQRFMFQIEEGRGVPVNSGGIKMAKREVSVVTYVSLLDTLEMAHEVLDFIRHQELISLMNDKPLYSYYEPQQQKMNNNNFIYNNTEYTEQHIYNEPYNVPYHY